MPVTGQSLFGVLFLVGVLCPGAAAADFDKTVPTFLDRHCTFCHNGKLVMAGLNLEMYKDPAAASSASEVWEKVARKLRSGEMPPPGRPRPSADELKAVMAWIDTQVAPRKAPGAWDPGRVTARRLNRAEYNYTIRDLLGLDIRPADDFPADDSGYGFDNIGDALTLSPVLMERYLAAAEKIAREAIVIDRPMEATQDTYRPESMPSTTGEAVWPSEFETEHEFPVEAEYDITVGVGGRRPDGARALELAVWLDERQLGRREVYPDSSKRTFEQRLAVQPGKHILRAALIEDASHVDDSRGEPPGPNTREHNIVLDHFEIVGPFNQKPRPLTAAHRRIFICGHRQGEHQPGCARRILENLARRAYRRPAGKDEISALDRFVELARQEGGTLEEGIQLALQAVLVSPHFLFRIERDPAAAGRDAIHRINDFELASRLSYFLWSSMPDDELFRLAEVGKLHEPEVLDVQVRRMVQDPKSRALVENFAGQWLQLRNLALAKPDPDRFPRFDDELRGDMRRETEMFFQAVMREDRSILDFIDGRFTYLNERLARHYGIEGIKGDYFRRVELDGGQRSGILTQASILTISSYPTRTSPVLRGLWVLENFLGTPPPPPPPDVPALDDSAVGTKGTLRQQLEQHRANPTCAVCHNRMDPLGFGLENYDPVGQWRTHDGKFPIETAGILPNGRSFESPKELKEILKSDGEAFAGCLSEKMLTYALGRGLEEYDEAAVKSIAKAVAENDYRFSTLVLEIVRSLPFQMRRGDAGPAKGGNS